LDYPVNLIDCLINEFLHNIDNISAPDKASDGTSNTVAPPPLKDQKSAKVAVTCAVAFVFLAINCR